MINIGVGLDSIDFLLYKTRKVERANLIDEVERGIQKEVKEQKRC